MKNIREDVVNKSKALAAIAYYGGETSAYSDAINLCIEKMDVITNKDSKEYNILNEIVNEIEVLINRAKESEDDYNLKLKESLDKEKTLSEQSANLPDSAQQ
ncbi:hypothetical protein [Staphylococcus caeli]|uniref:hypothetical protein n=1 Tax=Staphylococcus caeli TaxID=2201815 RepID=UPI003F5454D7